MLGAEIRDRLAISGIGWTDITKASGQSVLSLATQAAMHAIDDAGLRPADIDGLATFYWAQRDTPAPSELANSLGLTACHMSYCDSGGGGWACSSIAAAAMAVYSGMCNHVLVYRASNSRSEPIIGTGLDFWPSGQRQWHEPFGAGHAATLYGPHVSAYMAHYGVENADFAPLAVQQRHHASLNRKALMTKPISEEDHQQSPWIISPFRLLDCSIWNDGAMAVIVSRADVARHLRRSLVTIRAMEGGTLGAPVKARTSKRYWEVNAQTAAKTLYEKAGMTPDDMDLAQLYDPFTGMTMLHIEQFGLASPGGGPDAVRAGHLGLDGRCPLNTHGGHLSEGNLAGLGHVIEAVQQLRAGGVCDDYCEGAHDHDRHHCRQVRNAEVALVGAESGDSALILKRGS